MGDVGLIKDRDAHDIPNNAWTTLNNIRCKHGKIQPVDGYSDITSISPASITEKVHCHQLTSFDYGGTYYYVYPYDGDDDGVAESIYKYNGIDAPSEITRTTGDYVGSAEDLWQVCEFNGLVILNNGVDAPQYWDGLAANATYLPYDSTDTWVAVAASGETEFDTNGDASGNTYRAKVIRPFQNYLFALDITEDSVRYGNMVHWSNPADPGAPPDSWNYRDEANDAGRQPLAQTKGYVIDALPLGDQLIIYKEDAIYSASFIGGQYIFDFDLISTSNGLWSTNCVVDIGGVHVVMGDGTVYVHSGGQPKPILEGKLADDFFNSVDSDNYKKCFLTHNKSEQEVWFCHPTSGETWANRALIWNYNSDTWYYRDIPSCSTIKNGIVSGDALQAWNAADYSALTWDTPGMLDQAWGSRTYSPIGDTQVGAEQELIQFGVGITSDMVEAIRTNIVMESPDKWHMITKILPEATGDAFSLRIGLQDTIDDVVSWKDAQTFTPGTDHKLDERATGKVFAIEIMGNADYTITGYSIDATPEGTR